MTIPAPRPPQDGPHLTPRALLARLDHDTLTLLHHTETVRDDPTSTLHLICAWGGGEVRRVTITCRTDGRYDLTDERVRAFPWQVTVVASRAGVTLDYVSTKLREFARQNPAPAPSPTPARRPPMTPPASPQPPERPALPVRVVAWEDVEKVGPLILKSDGSTALTVTLKSGEVFAVPGSWSPIHPLGAWTTNP